MLALGDAIPVEYDKAPWLEAVVAEADIIEDRKPLEAAVLAVMGHHSIAAHHYAPTNFPISVARD